MSPLKPVVGYSKRTPESKGHDLSFSGLAIVTLMMFVTKKELDISFI